MRTLLVLWLAPLAIFWSWYFLSLNDVSDLVFSRALHDHVFAVYGEMLGIDPSTIPPMIAKALVFDSLVLGAIIAFRRRRRIAEWWRRRRPAEPVA